MLCTGLAESGVAGYPVEYFIPWDEPGWLQLWRIRSFEDFLHVMLLEGTSPNGVFSTKIMWGHVAHILGRVTGIPQYRGLEAPQLFPAIFPNVHYVWLSRRNLLRQAVSHAKAIQTGVWAVTAPEPDATEGTPDCDVGLIERLYQEVSQQERCWQQFFDRSHIQPLRLWYEDLVEDYPGTLRQVLSHVQVPIPNDLDSLRPSVSRQSSSLNERWVHLCRERVHDEHWDTTHRTDQHPAP